MRAGLKTKDITAISFSTALICLCSWISVPAPLPFTLQTLGIFLAVGLLGGRRGTISVVLYILLGCIGLPVFSGFSGGIGVVLGPTGGYIIGFIASALVIWIALGLLGEKLQIRILAMFLGLAVCYIFGSVWYMAVYLKESSKISFLAVLSKCVLPFIIPDGLKIFAAVFIIEKFKKYIK